MHIGLLGFGVVGAGVYDWTRGRADLTVDRVLVRAASPASKRFPPTVSRTFSTTPPSTRSSRSWAGAPGL